MIKIEIISETGTDTTAAFYYPVPLGKQLPAAADNTRTAAGSALSAQELQDLKDGKLFEYMYSTGTRGMTTPERQSKLVSAWATSLAAALKQYEALYSAAGDYYDGSTWQ